jgi:limonene-1,2-epoxide hydrolase
MGGMTAPTTVNGTSATVAPAEVVKSFLQALEANDLDAAMALLTEDAEWINVSLPTIHGRRAIERACRMMLKMPGAGFRVHFHNVAAEGNVVLTERTDAIAVGRFEQRFWVYGRFELEHGRIRVWRDSFDWADITVSLVRGLAGIVSPALNRRWPGSRS